MKEPKKILKIEKAEQSLAFLLMAMNVSFAFYYGDFYILNTHDSKKFYNFLEKHGVRKSELETMIITETEKDFLYDGNGRNHQRKTRKRRDERD